MTQTAAITKLESEAQRFAKLAQFEASPRDAAFFRARAKDLMAEAGALRCEDPPEPWLLRVAREGDEWYAQHVVAQMPAVPGSME